MQHRDTQKLRDGIRALYLEGHSQYKISQRLRCSRQTVGYHLHRLGLAPRTQDFGDSCCICGKEAIDGLPVCSEEECVLHYTDSEDCNPTDTTDAMIHKPSGVVLPEGCACCNADPGRFFVFANQTDHIRHHYYMFYLNRGIHVRMKPPVPIFHTGPDRRGRHKETYYSGIKEDQKRRGYLRWGKEIKELRKKKNMTQNMLAHLAHVKQSAIHFYETGKREPKVSTAHRIAHVLGVKMEDIWVDEYFLRSNNK